LGSSRLSSPTVGSRWREEPDDLPFAGDALLVDALLVDALLEEALLEEALLEEALLEEALLVEAFVPCVAARRRQYAEKASKDSCERRTALLFAAGAFATLWRCFFFGEAPPVLSCDASSSAGSSWTA